MTPGIKLTALADELGAPKHEYAALRELLLELVEEGVAHVLPGGAFALAPFGRSNDPSAKPTPPVRGELKGYKEAVARGRRGSKADDKKRAALPWQKKPAAAPKHATPPPRRPVVRPPPATESTYDPDTGEILGTVAAKSTETEVRPNGGPVAVHTGLAQTVDPRVTGRITVHPAGYGFVATEGRETVFVPAKYRGTSLDGDRVVVDTWPGFKGTEGRVTEILARGRARLTGILRRVGRTVYLEPDDPRISADYGRVGIDDAPTGKDGDAVVVEITRYPDTARRELAGKVLKVLGDPEDPRTEIEKILACASIPMEFPDDTAAQARNTPQELGPNDLADRIDLRSRRFCTIDPETARDFDDALCIEDGPHGGPRVWVAVADVSHYVRWNDPLDREATIRGVSVYLPDRVIPMLPHELSSNICSLNPNVDRCAMVVRLDLTNEGEIIDIAYSAAVIRSKGRLDYPGVAAALEGDFRGRREIYKPWIDELTRMHALSRKMRARRAARGALDLELSEAKVILDADDPRLVRDVVKAKGDPAVKQAMQLVEEYMIAANEAVGTFFRKRTAPTVWRVHAPPAEDRVRKLAELMGAYGINVDVEESRKPLGMKNVLDQIAEKPGAQALTFLVLRTLTQAVWDTTPIGHFGLASSDYLHFTSPIRRYPDLLVHRLLKHHLHKEGQASGGGYDALPPGVEILAELARASSQHERRAMEAEREAVAMYRCYLMRDQVGEEFEGVISAVTSFGAFVEIDEPFVEGLIKLDSLGTEIFDYDEIHMRLSGRKSGKSIELGDRVKVQINNVSVIRRRIDLTLIAVAQQRTRPKLPVQDVAKIKRDLGTRKIAAREVARAVTGTRDRSAPAPRGKSGTATAARGTNGKIRLGVSHRGPSSGGAKKKDGGGGGGGKKRGR
ncbi:MAG: ribonuclease R [Deltaproteobacteria bacterium]|nr:ribonuclease R [Deltaproteobacteria bacterium]